MIIHLKYIYKLKNKNHFKGDYMIIFAHKKIFIYANWVSRSIWLKLNLNNKSL